MRSLAPSPLGFPPRHRQRITPFLCALFAAAAVARAALPLDQPLHALAAVGREGQGNEAASQAWKQVVAGGPDAVLPLLATMGAGPVADNWLRLAGDAIVEQAQRARHPLPVPEMESFLRDQSHPASGRQFAFDLLQRADRPRADALEPSLINDPVQGLRRGAVQRLIEAARQQTGDAATATWEQALDAVRDEDQTRQIAGALEKLGVKVDLPKHFGFLMKWQVIGPFDNTDRKGFETVNPPEKEIRLDATYEGKGGQPVKWVPFTSQDDYGKIDLNKPLGMLKEATGYAVTTLEAAEDREAELRLGCKDAWKVWLNGEFLFGRDEYHRGQQLDQYKLKCHLRKGTNTVLVKCCQNEQKEMWTVEWEFQLRLCDSAGTALYVRKDP